MGVPDQALSKLYRVLQAMPGSEPTASRLRFLAKHICAAATARKERTGCRQGLSTDALRPYYHDVNAIAWPDVRG